MPTPVTAPTARAGQPLRGRSLLALLGALALALGLLAAPVPAAAQEGEVRADVTPARVDGDTRLHTAAALAALTFEQADVAHLVRADDFPDALSASYAAGALGGPILLTDRTSAGLDDDAHPTASALADLDVSTVVLIGGEDAIDPAVEDELTDAGYDVDRVSGVDRYQTAASVAMAYAEAAGVGQLEGDRTAIIASGDRFADALAAGPVAAAGPFPLLLTPEDRSEAAIGQVLDQLAIDRIIIVGGPDVVSAEVVALYEEDGYAVERWAGDTRTQTAAVVATNAVERLGFDASRTLLARGDDFADALAASAHAGAVDSPLLLTATPDVVDDATTGWLADACPSVEVVRAVGGVAAVSIAVLSDAVDAAAACLEEEDAWTPTADAPIDLRRNHTATWTGTEMIVWGGGDADDVHADGAAYDPAADTWRTVPAAPIEARWAHVAAWTGDELLVWGGHGGPDHLADCFADGAAYDPTADTWRTLADAPGDGRCGATATWTGDELVIAGGSDSEGPPERDDFATDVIAYDPAADTWRSSPDDDRLAGSGAVVAWTGDEVLVHGGTDPDFDPQVDGLAWDPDADVWRDVAAAPFDRAASTPSGGWAGGELIVLGDHTPDVGETTPAAAYDPATDAWRTIDDVPAGHTPTAEVAWSGSALHVIGGDTIGGDAGDPSHHAWLPDEDQWVELPSPPASPVIDHTLVWADDRLVVWGGEARPEHGMAGGAVWVAPTAD